MHEAAVLVQDGFGEAGGTGGKIDGGIIVVLEADERSGGRAVHDQLIIALSKRGAGIPDKEEQTVEPQMVNDGFNTPDELRPEEHDIDIGKLGAVEDFIG